MASESCQIEKERRKGHFKRVLLLLLLLAHAGFFLSQSLGMPFSMEQLFLLGQILVLADTGLLVVFGLRLLRRRTDA